MQKSARHRAERGTHPSRWAAVLGAVIFTVGAAAQAAPDDSTTTAESYAGEPVAVSAPERPGSATPGKPQPSKGPPVTDQTKPAADRRSPVAPPAALSIPSLAVTAPVLGVRMDSSKGLTPPDDPKVLGWWSQGAPAGAAQGATLVTGHTVHSGGGALDDLETVAMGARVRVRTARGNLDYVVRSVRVYSKGRLAEDAGALFGQVGPHRLVLVTCEDWNGEEYESNVVVVAHPA